MAELKIKIAAETLSATEGITKVTESISALGNKVIKTGEGFDQYQEALSRDLQKIWDVNPQYTALQKQQKLLQNETSKMTIAFGSQSDKATALNDALKIAQQNLSDYDKNTEKASKSTKQIAESTEDFGNKLSSLKLLEVAKNILKFHLLMKPITQLMSFFSSTISSSMEVAAEAEQVFNKLTTVFENNASAMGKAQQMAQSYGTSISTMASALSTVGDLLQAQGMGKSESLEMASQWTAAFSDIIAFKDINMTVEEFAQNFMSGAAGNLRNFRTFGSIVKESAVNAELAKKGLSDLTGEELELEKMVIRANLALEQQANAIGATESEWNTVLSVNRRLSEQWKEFKESLGTGLNTAIYPIKKMFAEILENINKINAAAKEMSSGDYTIKSENAFTLDKSGIAQIKALYAKQLAWNQGNAQQINQNTNLTAGTYQGNITVAGSKGSQLKGMYAEMVTSIAMATGATVDQIKEVLTSVDKSFGNAADGVWELAQQQYNNELASLKRNDARTKQLQDLAESSIKDYEDNLTAMFSDSGDMASWLSGSSFADHDSADYLLGKNGGTLEENTSEGISSISEILAYIRTTLPKITGDKASLVSQLEQAETDYKNNVYGSTGNVHLDQSSTWTHEEIKAQKQLIALDQSSSWTQEEIKAQKQLIASLKAQIQSIDSTTEAWTSMDEELTAKLSELYTMEAKASAKSSVDETTQTLQESNATNEKRTQLEAQYTDELSYMVDIFMQEYEYQKQYAEMLQTLTEAGYADEEATALLATYKDEYTKAIQEATKSAEAEALQTKKEKEQTQINSIKEGTADYQKQLRQLTMTDSEKILDDLQTLYDSSTEIVQDAVTEQIEAYKALEKATEELNSEQALKEMRAEMGSTALNSLGTVGSAVSTFLYEDGDIWSKILKVCLDIFSQSESWTEVIEFINQVIEPLLPVVDAILAILVSLEGVFEIIAFVMKVISTLIVEVLHVINMICDVFEWFWDNLKIAIRNLGVDIYNAFHWFNQKDKEKYTNLIDYWNETTAQTGATLQKIWQKIPEEDNGDFETLENLLTSGIINLDQYNAGLRVAQKGMIFDPVTPVDYIATSNTPSTTVQYGDVSLTINGGNIDETQRVVIRLLRQAGYDVSSVPITA